MKHKTESKKPYENLLFPGTEILQGMATPGTDLPLSR